MIYPNSLNQLIEAFKKLPGIGEKTAERLAFSVIEFDEEVVKNFSSSIYDAKTKIRKCEICNHLTEEKTCSICSDNKRDHNTLCVVADNKTVFLFEKLGIYKGYYHILDGLISPLDGINPEDINIEVLVERIKNSQFKEIILVFKPSIEGETTALYISKILEGLDIVISKIAHGIPMGADMEYIDELTLEMAMSNRNNIS
ncbi:MAG: recombination mediator RecR [Bacilli bacterium]|nr:recombination mediator RecR [Bacilli bacterium]